MRQWIDDVVPTLVGPPQALRDEALLMEPSGARHAALAAAIPALNVIEVLAPPVASARAGRIVLAAWNAERCKYLGPSADLLRATGADVILLTEMDLGMARSGNAHTTRELAAMLGMGHVFATEYVELDLGDDREKAWHAGQSNHHGLHGNAILSRLPLRNPARVALDDGAVWFRPGTYQNQRRIGSRCAVLAVIDLDAGPVAVASLHLESHSDPADRAAQIRRIVAAIDQRFGTVPAVIAGDLNTSALPRGADPEDTFQPWFMDPAPLEPLFAVAAAAGYRWADANTPGHTCRTRPDGAPRPPFSRIDWMLVRGLAVNTPRVWPAVDGAGSAISDHELLTLELEVASG